MEHVRPLLRHSQKISVPDKLNAKQCSLLNLEYLIHGKVYMAGVAPHVYVIRLSVFYKALYARVT
jgi:hypothetical protein